MNDLIRRQAAIEAIENTDWYHQNANKDMVSGASNEHEAWYKADDVYNALESVPSAQPEQDIEHCETCIHSTDSEDICILRKCKYAIAELIDCYEPKQPERMTNRQWIDFLSAQFGISRTSAKEMLHGMMQWKKEDNFKKLFNGGRERS